MKTLNTIMKVVTALAAVAGAIYVVATYGEEIVAWCKKVLASLPKCPCCEPLEDDFVDETPVEEVPVEEAPAEEPEEVPAEEEAADEADEEPVEEIPLTPAPNEPVADEHDFAE